MNSCECQRPGFCDRHQCDKSPHWWRRCRSDPHAFLSWEEFTGPGQDPNAPSRFKTASRRQVGITVLMITHGRLEYTKLAVEAMLKSAYSALQFVIWDNASRDGTREWLLQRTKGDERIRLILSNRNVGIVHPMNSVWGDAITPLVAKIDNDTVVPATMLERLASVCLKHRDIGVVSGCHFHERDLNGSLSILSHQSHPQLDQILRQPHVGGCAVMMRRATFVKHGRIPGRTHASNLSFVESGWTEYQRKLNRQGYINGYPLPLIYVDHMEDTRSPNHIASHEHENYKKSMRGKSLAECTEQLYVQGARQLNKSGQIEYLTQVDRQNLPTQPVTLFIPLSGRVDKWCELASFLNRQAFPHDQVQLVLLDTSQSSEFNRLIATWTGECDYSDVRVLRRCVGPPGLADQPRRDVTPQVRAAMAKIYSELQRLVNTEFTWILEDDISAPEDVCQRLLNSMSGSTASVAAPYRSRFGERFVVWDRSGVNFQRSGTAVQRVGGNGFGCVLLRSEPLKHVVLDPAQDVDRQYYRWLSKQNAPAMVDWSCQCEHGTTAGVLLSVQD